MKLYQFKDDSNAYCFLTNGNLSDYFLGMLIDMQKVTYLHF
ncbi:hypothetical protein EV201_2420 [Ancylomarina subtilis]|uniref:Uncharacterized protein n=1 Tax=Ancylomarina subtilis TaxID=1639035 RepID=A0A4Q7VE63_9BACT|nr:hypothetical protein EV201_2420 [Ancylomarina subtilis]